VAWGKLFKGGGTGDEPVLGGLGGGGGRGRGRGVSSSETPHAQEPW